MKKTLKKLCCLSLIALLSSACMLACSKKSEEAESTESTEFEYPTREKPTIDKTNIDPYDGDINFRVPSDITLRNAETTYGTVETVQYYSTTVGKNRDVSIIFPPNYSADKEYPVLYVFHGLGQDNTQWIKDGKVDVITGNMLASGEC